MKLLRALSLAVLSILAASRVHAQADPAARALNQPVVPYRILGNLYYVGASDITSFLITTPSGHILLDGGYVETAPMIAEDFARSFRVLKSLPCDAFLGPHASFYDGLEKARKLRAGAKENPFIDPQGYRSYLETREKMYQDQLQKERAASPARLANSGCALPNSDCALPNSRKPLSRGGPELARGGRALRGFRCALAEGLSPLANSREPLAWRGPAPARGTPESARAQPKFPKGGPALQGDGPDSG
jgi:hypothetical protein